MNKRLYLIDGHAQIFRAFYAVEGLTAPDGRPSNAIYVFTRMLLDIINRHRPDYIVAVFDAPGKSFRHERYPEYKATRRPTPPELVQQIPVIQEIVAAYRIPVISVPGFEADDVIGTLVKQAGEQGQAVTIVTADKDCSQLLDDKVCIWDAQHDRFITKRTFEEEKGISPHLFPDMIGLWGDSSDNIPGVPGIGEKIAQQLLRKYGGLEEALAHAGEVPGKRGEALRAHAQDARLSKELAIIRRDAPVALDLDAAKIHEPDYEKLTAIFTEFGFKSLLASLRSGAATDTGKKEERDYRLVNTPEAFNAFWQAIADAKHFAVDTEATGLDPMAADLVGISFSWQAGQGWYLPFRGPTGETVLGEAELRQVGELLADETRTKTGQNLKYDLLVLRRAGIEMRGVTFDTLLASSILNSHLREHDLDTLARRYLGLEKISISTLLGTGKKQRSMAEVPLAEIADYACEDADVAWRLEPLLARELLANDERRVLDELELPLMLVLADMQATGVRVDCNLLQRQSVEIGEILASLTEEIHRLAGHPFNLASPKQLAVVLFEEMKLPVIHRTQTGPSTDEETLTTLAKVYGAEIATLLLDYRMYAKLKNTYLDALPAMVNPATGRIHTTFSQTATATGRLSSHDPNLQNIPVRTEKGKAVRAAFLPEEGWRMVAADYSQIELRILAHYSRDEALLRAFADGQDIHTAVAARIYETPVKKISADQRAAAKAVNFGVIYGQTAHGLAQSIGLSHGQAQNFIDDYFRRFPGVKAWIDATIAQAHSYGYVRTMLGRRRLIPDLASHNKSRRSRAEREAVNTVIQGSAADLIKTAMLRIHRRICEQTLRSRLLLQIHDELVFEVPPTEIKKMSALVKREMENAIPLEVPVVVEIGEGRNWLEAK